MVSCSWFALVPVLKYAYARKGKGLEKQGAPQLNYELVIKF
jgi:hypothetical protein